MKVHLIDGTYELFRAHYGAPPGTASDGRQVGATLGLLRSMISLLTQPDTTHVAIAFDHVIESFRNDLYAGYKTGEGIDPDLFAQFHLAEDAMEALGLVVWPMVEFEADDALAAAATRFESAAEVEQVLICSPDKDLAQCVLGTRVVCLDRRRNLLLDEAGVKEKFGVFPTSIPDWLALVGDTSDGYPGIEGWGAKSAAEVLARYGRLEAIPDNPSQLGLPLGRATKLALSLRQNRPEALLYRRLATLRRDVPLRETLHDLEWGGARSRLKDLLAELGEEGLLARIPRWRER